MKAYELKQSLLDRMEIEGLIERIKKLEIEVSIKDLQIKALKEDLDYSKQLTLIAKINNI
jgi:predicted RNase H-like nuclease (RuvC/YqgF family)